MNKIENFEENDYANYRVLNNCGQIVDICPGNKLKAIVDQYGLDLVMVNNQSDPKIVKLIDFQKYQYQLKKSFKDNNKKQRLTNQKIKEIKFHIGIAENDLNHKINHINQFLQKGFKVKLSVVFKGRENSRKKEGYRLLNNILTQFDNYINKSNEVIKSVENTIFVYLN